MLSTELLVRSEEFTRPAERSVAVPEEVRLERLSTLDPVRDPLRDSTRDSVRDSVREASGLADLSEGDTLSGEAARDDSNLLSEPAGAEERELLPEVASLCGVEEREDDTLLSE